MRSCVAGARIIDRSCHIAARVHVENGIAMLGAILRHLPYIVDVSANHVYRNIASITVHDYPEVIGTVNIGSAAHRVTRAAVVMEHAYVASSRIDLCADTLVDHGCRHVDAINVKAGWSAGCQA